MAWYFFNLNYQQRKAATRRPARVTDTDNLFRFKNYWLFKSTFPLFICYHSFFFVWSSSSNRVSSFTFSDKVNHFFLLIKFVWNFNQAVKGVIAKKLFFGLFFNFSCQLLGFFWFFSLFVLRKKKRPETNHFWLSISFHCFSPDFQILDVLATCSFFILHLSFFFKRRSQVEISPPIFLFVTWQLNLHFCWGIF